MNRKHILDLINKITQINNKNLPGSIQKEIENEAEQVYGSSISKKNGRVLIIGGAGYIGTVLTKHLLECGYIVRCLDLLLYKNSTEVLQYIGDKNYEFLYGDLCDKKTVENALEGVDSVVLLAGLVGDPITKKYPGESFAINNKGVKSAIDLMNGKGLHKFIFISTCSNYGLINDNELADEDHELNPLSLYAAAKVEMEQYLLSLKGKVDFHPTILRFATAFGLSSRMRFDLTISEFIYELFNGNELLVYDANTWRPYCHVQDFSTLIRRVIEFPANKTSFEVFNAGGEVNNFTKQGVVNLITKYLPDSKINYKDHGSDPRNYRVNFNKVKSTLYFEPSYTVEDGVKELINALNHHLFDQVEENRNIFGNYEINYPPNK